MYALNDCNLYKTKKHYIKWAFTNCVVRLCNVTIYLILKYCGHLYNIHNLNRNASKVAISLTSFPDRIKVVWMTIDSLFHQSIMPGHICLYLSIEDFPEKEKNLPKSLLQYEKYGLEIFFVEDNIRPHKKYLYAMKQHPDWMVITVDDDIYYRDDMVAQLLKLHQQFPYCVCANIVHEIAYDLTAEHVLSYLKWQTPILNSPKASMFYVAIGCGGVLYPPNIFHESHKVFDIDEIKRICLTADDLWLKSQELLIGVAVAANAYYCMPPTIPTSQRVALINTNVGCYCNNDKQWHKLEEAYSLNKILKCYA